MVVADMIEILRVAIEIMGYDTIRMIVLLEHLLVTCSPHYRVNVFLKCISNPSIEEALVWF